MDGNPAPDTNVYLTNINQLGTPGRNQKAEEIEIDDETLMFEKGARDNFTLAANRSIESAEILCRGVNKFGRLSASRILYVHGRARISFSH